MSTDLGGPSAAPISDEELSEIRAQLEALPTTEWHTVRSGNTGYLWFPFKGGRRTICWGEMQPYSVVQFIGSAPKTIAALVAEVERLRAGGIEAARIVPRKNARKENRRI